MDSYGNGLAILESSVLFIIGTILLGVAAFVFARAFAEVQRGRSQRSSADAHEETVRVSKKALDEIDEHRSPDDYSPYIPTEQELFDAARMTDATPPSRNGHAPPKPGTAMYEPEETTTMRNENIEEGPPIPRDELYRMAEDPFS